MKLIKKQMAFAEQLLSQRITHNVTLEKTNALIDWQVIEKELNKYYKKGQSTSGRPAYSGLLLFKMLLLGIWNNLSARDLEYITRVRLDYWVFLGLSLEMPVPDHSVLI